MSSTHLVIAISIGILALFQWFNFAQAASCINTLECKFGDFTLNDGDKVENNCTVYR